MDRADTVYDKHLVLATKLDSDGGMNYGSYIAKYPKLSNLQNSIGDLLSNEVELKPLNTSFDIGKNGGLSTVTIRDCVYVFEIRTGNACNEAGDFRPRCGEFGPMGWEPKRVQYTTLISTTCGSAGGDTSYNDSTIGGNPDYSGTPGDPSGTGYGSPIPGDTTGSPFINPDGPTPFSPDGGCTSSSLDVNGDCSNDPDLFFAEMLMLENFYDSLDPVDRNRLQRIENATFRHQIGEYLKQDLLRMDDEQFAREAVKEKKVNLNTEVDFENKSIYHATVPDCLKEIIDKFKPAENISLDISGFDNPLQQHLNIAGQTLALFNNDGGYGIKFEVFNMPGVNASTMPEFNMINGVNIFSGVTIRYHEGYLARATDLTIARSSIHELVHAYLLYAGFISTDSTLDQALDNLLDPVSFGAAHHQLMAEQFAGSIASALQAWDNYSKRPAEYDYMSWSGAMIRTDNFQNLPHDFQDSCWERMYAEEGRLFPPASGFTDIEALGESNCN